jgi:dTDP-4-dehydrorhamnose reductase
MLGSMVADYLSRDESLELRASFRPQSGRPTWSDTRPSVRWVEFSGADDLHLVDDHEWIVNCAGVIKPLIDDSDPAKVENAIRVNSLLPHQLVEAAAASGGSIIQIATDCVYAGTRGRYSESDVHDATDVYGKTKSLGEVTGARVHHIRASIVGPEAARSRSLLEWFLAHQPAAQVNGFVNHLWNGVTTLQFAKVVRAVIAGAGAPGTQHLVPGDVVSKYELLRAFAEAYERNDLEIRAIGAPTVIDRTLATEKHEGNIALWLAAGYDRAPTVAEMVAELAAYPYMPARLKSPA